MSEFPSITEVLQTNAEAFRALLPEYLSRQRWFGAKSRTILSARPVITSSIESQHAVLMNVVVQYKDETTETYQLPLALKLLGSGEDPDPWIKSTVATFRGSTNVALLYDATQNSDFRDALLHMAEDSDLAPGESRVSSAEQSNTSIIYGNNAILKLFRRIQPGENPDVEISRFLTQVAHFEYIPAYLGQLRADDGSTLAYLQAFAPNEGDGWEWMQKQLASLLGKQPQASANQSLEAAALLGRRTAEMHLALAVDTSDAAFAPEQFTPSELTADSTRLRNQVTIALDALKLNLSKVETDLMQPVAQLLGKRKDLLAFADALATASPYRFGRRIRVHGDYHLGQVLRTNDGFLIVDFEGEPAKSLEERRRKQSPLRDVAGMLRSFSYAAASALKACASETQNNASEATAAWEKAACTAFIDTYLDVMTAHPELLPQREQLQSLLKAFLIEKALYELLYELNNRPSWLRIPLDGVLSLLREVA